MAIDLVTGHAGTEHVSSTKMGRYNAGVCGTEKYVLKTGQQFAYSIESANLIQIGSGDAIDQGRHITIPHNTYEAATIQNGTQGKTRIDVIALKYEKTSSVVDGETVSIESASLEVIRGTEVDTGSTPEAPAVTEGDIFAGASTDYMPLYNVLITDTTVTSVTAVFTVLDSLADHIQDTNDIADLQSDVSALQSGVSSLAETVANLIQDAVTGASSTWSSAKLAAQITAITTALDEAMTWKQCSTDYLAGKTWFKIPDTAKEIFVALHISHEPSLINSVNFHVPVVDKFFPSSDNGYHHFNYWGTDNNGFARIRTKSESGKKYVQMMDLYNGTTATATEAYWTVFYR